MTFHADRTEGRANKQVRKREKGMGKEMKQGDNTGRRKGEKKEGGGREK